jgi:hypothetical protein
MFKDSPYQFLVDYRRAKLLMSEALAALEPARAVPELKCLN